MPIPQLTFNSVIVCKNKKESRLYYYIVFLGNVAKFPSKIYANEILIEIQLKDFLTMKSEIGLEATETKDTELEDITIYK